MEIFAPHTNIATHAVGILDVSSHGMFLPVQVLRGNAAVAQAALVVATTAARFVVPVAAPLLVGWGVIGSHKPELGKDQPRSDTGQCPTRRMLRREALTHRRETRNVVLERLCPGALLSVSNEGCDLRSVQ